MYQVFLNVCMNKKEKTPTILIGELWAKDREGLIILAM